MADRLDPIEQYLTARVLDALFRENYRGLADYVEVGGGERLLRLPGRAAAIALQPNQFLQEWVVRRPVEVGLDEVFEMVHQLADPADAEGVEAFTAECYEALAGLRLRTQHQSTMLSQLAALRAAAEQITLGPGTWYDTLASYIDHPVYPTAHCRFGVGIDDLKRYAPEFDPSFELLWLAIPRTAVVKAGELPAWWPLPSTLGLPPEFGLTHELFPLHPLTEDKASKAAEEVGLSGQVIIAPHRYLTVKPTLSVRTVAVTGYPNVHLKLPLPMSSLGIRNRRSIQPRTLTDGALMQRLLASLIARESHFSDQVLLSDEGIYRHAHNEYLGYLLRRFPADLERSRVVPVAALLASSTSGPLVIEELAVEYSEGNVLELLDHYLSLLFNFHVTLFVGYGIALEAHQQNISVVLSIDQPRLRLLIKDNDGALVYYPWLSTSAADRAILPVPTDFADQRMLAADPEQLADVFITIALHLDAAALIFGLAEQGLAPLSELLALLRRQVVLALSAHAGHPRAEVLRARLLETDRLPIKSMVTAGTLVAKARTGAQDINKYYGATTANYLRSVN
ncbi:MAG: IucA/IucC family protein [Candidatus Dormibacteraceae bacterium]